MTSTDPPGELQELLDSTTRARFMEGGVADGVALGKRVALELSGDDARELVQHLRVAPPAQPFHCMCLGDWGIELFAGKRRLVTIGLHHGRSIRIDEWSSDALLLDGEALLRFLADRGLGEPLAAFEADQAMGERFAVARRHWLAATPTPIRDLLAELEGEGPGRRLSSKDATVLEALSRLGAANQAPTRAVLAWYAAGMGPWSGYPSYEDVACALLTALGAEQVVRAAEASQSEDELLGAARFLSRWNAPPRERRLLTVALAKRLRAVTDARGDDDARARMAAALKPLEAPAGGPSLGRSENARDFAFVVAVDVPEGGPAVVALDNPELLLLTPGQRRVLCDGLTSVGALAACGSRVVLTRLDSNEIVSVDVTSGAIETLASDVPAARCLTMTGDRIAWVEQRERYIVRELGREPAWAEQDENAWDLRIAGHAPVWGRAHQPLLGGGARYYTEIATVDQSGKIESLARLKGDDNYVYPRFDANAQRIACTTGRDVTIVDRSSGKKQALGLGRRIQSVVLDGGALWVIALSKDRYGGELLRVDLASRTIKRHLSYQRMLYHQEQLSLGATHVAWRLGGEALSVARR